MVPLAPPLIDPELDQLATWLADTAPPTAPIVLARDPYGRPWLTVDDPALFWAYCREQLAAGLRGQVGRGLLQTLRRVKEAMTI